MKQRIVAVLGALSLLAMAGCASTPDKTPVKEEKAATQPAEPAMVIREKVSATATVKAINLETRQVTLQGKKGKPFTITVSEAVTNLPQVKVGDQVVVTYYEALMVQLTGKAAMASPGEPTLSALAALNRARCHPAQCATLSRSRPTSSRSTRRPARSSFKAPRRRSP